MQSRAILRPSRFEAWADSVRVAAYFGAIAIAIAIAAASVLFYTVEQPVRRRLRDHLGVIQSA